MAMLFEFPGGSDAVRDIGEDGYGTSRLPRLKLRCDSQFDRKTRAVLAPEPFINAPGLSVADRFIDLV